MTSPILSTKVPSQTQTLIVGAGITGLLAAALRLKQGKSVLLVEALDKMGGRQSPELRDGFQLGAGFAFSAFEAFEKIAEKLDLPLDGITLENGGSLQHGTRGWSAVEELPSWEEHLALTVKKIPRGGMASLMQKLHKFCATHDNFHFSLSLPATAIQIKDRKVHSVLLGPEKEVAVEECIFTGPFKNLMELLQGEGVPEPGPARVAWLRKFSKTTSQPGVIVEFAHNAKVADFTETLLLPFGAADKEERRFLVGAFLGNRDESLMPAGKQVSSWILPLTEEEWADNHEIMKKIRAGKRLLEKAFAGFENSILFDRVLVLENTIAPLGKRKGEWHPIYDNLLPIADWASPSGAHFEGVLELLQEHC